MFARMSVRGFRFPIVMVLLAVVLAGCGKDLHRRRLRSRLPPGKSPPRPVLTVAAGGPDRGWLANGRPVPVGDHHRKRGTPGSRLKQARR